MTTDQSVDTVRVDLADAAYDIHIGTGLLERAGDYLSPLMKRPKTVIVTDAHVAAAQLSRLEVGLKAAGIDYDVITLTPGEATKSFTELEALTSKLLDFGVERNDVIIALGGGVIGDLVGFAAAVLRRGCRFAQIPTSLLAQVDSSVGGKTAINVKQGKNLIGAFHQPDIVIADISALDSLPLRELRAGYAEVIKYGAIADRPFFEWLDENGAALLAGDAALRQYAVRKSCEAKADIVARDERERGDRALLNFGHTFGHALEAAYGYTGELLHGEAVALGMCLAFEFCVAAGTANKDDAERFVACVAKAGLPADIKALPQNDRVNGRELTELMRQDKKVEAGALTLILANALGDAQIVKNASSDAVEHFLKEKIGR